jgi:hypothetical protein
MGPIYGATGLGMLLYFAGQGSGRVAAPFLAGTFRLLFVIGGGRLAVVRCGAGLPTLFTIRGGSSFIRCHHRDFG